MTFFDEGDGQDDGGDAAPAPEAPVEGGGDAAPEGGSDETPAM